MARRFAEDNVKPYVRKTPTRTRVEIEEPVDTAFENDNIDESNYDGDVKIGEKIGTKRILLLLVACLLGFAIVGAGVYALVHFVILPDNTEPEVETLPAATTPPDPTLTPIPTQPATEAPTEPDYAAMADAYMADMTDEEKIYQLFIVTPEVLTGVDNATIAGPATEEAIKSKPVGGIVYSSNNFEDVAQTKDLISNSQSYTKTPMFIAVDEEGGDVAPVAEKLGTTKLDPMLSYEDEGEMTARDNAKTIASDIAALGFNLDLAPVADVLTNSDNTAIGQRAYSTDFSTASKLISAAVKGYKEGGVLCTLKHFPGHGSTAEDSHDTFAHVTATLDELKKGELLPFQSGIHAGADMVMAGHIIVDELDPELPATLSSKIVPELLRKMLSYDGVVISDSMSLACLDSYSYDATVKGIFDADIDIILMPDNLDRYVEAIKRALDDGTITQAQIDRKVKRILTLKFKEGIIPNTAAETSSEPATTSSTEAETTADAETATDSEKLVTDNVDASKPEE